MKKILLSLSLIGLAAGAYAQGQINLGNISNADNASAGPTASTGGLFWYDDFFNPAPPILINTDFNVNFYGGSDANSLILLKSFVASGGGAPVPGTFLDLSGVPVTIPGALTVGYFRIEAWVLGSSSFLSASAANFGSYNTVFSNPLGNPLASPPGTPTDLTGMPAIVITTIPEPSTFALVGLGAAALLIFRRRGLC